MSMKNLECDVAVIGAGSAGMAASATAAKAGAKVLLIESSVPGTTCARVGCMPSKLLIAAAEVAHSAATARVFGIQTAPIRVDGAAVLQRLRRERDRFVAAVVRNYEAIPQDRRLCGLARFVDGNTLIVGEQTCVRARTIVIATGSRPEVPAGFESVMDRVLSNDTLFELADLPDSVAVIGAGALGLEMGQALQRLGVRVAIFSRGRRIAGLRSEEMNAVAADVFAESLPLRLGVQTRAEALPDGLRLHWQGDEEAGSADFSRVLIAAGRPPNLESLQLHRAGIELDDHGVPVFDPASMRCGDSAIFIAGDADHDRALLHEAADEGRIAGANAAAYPQVKAQARRLPIAIVFSDPQVAVIGQARQAEHLLGRVSFSDQGRAKVMNKASGEIHLYGDAQSGEIIGAEMIGPGVEHLAHLLAWGMQLGQSAEQLLQLPFYHPTLIEGLRTALRDLCRQLPAEPMAAVMPMEYGPAV